MLKSMKRMVLTGAAVMMMMISAAVPAMADEQQRAEELARYYESLGQQNSTRTGTPPQGASPEELAKQRAEELARYYESLGPEPDESTDYGACPGCEQNSGGPIVK